MENALIYTHAVAWAIGIVMGAIVGVWSKYFVTKDK